jgi:hypothetical protein
MSLARAEEMCPDYPSFTKAEAARITAYQPGGKNNSWWTQRDGTVHMMRHSSPARIRKWRQDHEAKLRGLMAAEGL